MALRFALAHACPPVCVCVRPSVPRIPLPHPHSRTRRATFLPPPPHIPTVPAYLLPLPWPSLPFPLEHNTTQHNPAQHPTSTQTSLSLDRPHARHGHQYGHKDEAMHAPLPSFPFLSAPRHDPTRATRRGVDTVRAGDVRSVSFRSRCVSFCIHARNASQGTAEQSRAE
jgi:hypothetical protein